MESTRFITPDDLKNFKFVHDPVISSDGEEILFVVSEVKNENEYAGGIWKISGESPAIPVVQFGYRATNPVWSHDNEHFLFFVNYPDSQGKPTSEIWVSDRNGLDKKKILSIRNGKIIDPKWSPDSSCIYFLSDFNPSERSDACDVKVINRRLYRFDGKGYQNDRRTHVFRLEVKRAQILPSQVTSGKFDVAAFDLSPDGKDIAFVTNMDEDADFVNGLDIYTIPATGGQPQRIYRNKGPISSLSFSPNGKFVAYVGHDYRNKFNTPLQAWLLDLAKSESVNISAKLDRAARNSLVSDVSMDKWLIPPCWTADSGQILFLATDSGRCHIYAVEIATGNIRQITQGNSVVTSLSLSRNGKIAYVKNDSTRAPEMYLKSIGDPTNAEKQLTNFNQALFSKLTLGTPIEFFFNSRDGTKVHGFFTPPVISSKDGRPPPCIVEIHGGGGTEGFQFMQEFQCLAAKGYAVITCNYRGTQGYGEEYMKVLTGHYMDKDYSDIIDMINYAIEEKWIDKERIGVCGGSYGGYLTNWAIGHDGKLFSAAVADRSVVNLFSFYGTTDGYRLIEEDVQESFPWDRPQHYLEKSPISYTKNITTPLLIIHSDQDYRVVLEQAQQLYGFLKRQGKEVVMVEFPGESHGLSWGGKPHHRIERLQFYLWWFTSHIDTGHTPEPPPLPIPELE